MSSRKTLSALRRRISLFPPFRYCPTIGKNTLLHLIRHSVPPSPQGEGLERLRFFFCGSLRDVERCRPLHNSFHRRGGPPPSTREAKKLIASISERTDFSYLFGASNLTLSAFPLAFDLSFCYNTFSNCVESEYSL